MGELHLEIYVERMRREYNVSCTTGRPRVNYRETITQRADFNFTHKKQTGGAGQFARVIGYLEPMEPDPETGATLGFESRVVGGNIPSNYIPAVEKVYFRLTFRIHNWSDCLCRAFMRHARRVAYLETLSLGYGWCSLMVLSTLWTRLNLPSGLRLLQLFGTSTKPLGRLFWSRS
jgi:hypothetical protein